MMLAAEHPMANGIDVVEDGHVRVALLWLSNLRRAYIFQDDAAWLQVRLYVTSEVVLPDVAAASCQSYCMSACFLLQLL